MVRPLTLAKQVTLESLADYEDVRLLRDRDLLWNSTGTGTIGRVIRLVDPPKAPPAVASLDALLAEALAPVEACEMKAAEWSNEQ